MKNIKISVVNTSEKNSLDYISPFFSKRDNACHSIFVFTPAHMLIYTGTLMISFLVTLVLFSNTMLATCYHKHLCVCFLATPF
jgi:hypothetical protein